MIEDILYKRAINFPNKVFIEYNSIKYTYRQFDKFVNLVSVDINHKIQTRYINIHLQDKLLLFASIIACNRLNIIPVLNKKNNINPVDFNDEDFTNNTKGSDLNLLYKHNNHRTQAVVYSSGTTGTAKGIELTFDNFFNNSLIWADRFHFSSSDVYSNILPLNHVGGLCIMFRALYNNFAVKIDDFSIEFMKNFNNSCDYISIVPSMLYDIIYNSMSINFRNIKKIIVGGANINKDLLKEAIKLELPIYIVYGMTETCSGIAGAEINSKNYNNFKYRPFKYVDISVNKNNICINSPTVMKKYYNGSDYNDIFVSSDVGEVHKNGKFSINGRSDNVIISGGENFDPELIENIINTLSNVSNSKVIGLEDKKWGKKIIAIIETNNKVLNKDYYYQILKAKIPRKMMPKKIYIVTDINKFSRRLYL